jgi:hypothetical protein
LVFDHRTAADPTGLGITSDLEDMTGSGRATLHSLALQDRPTVVGAQTSTCEPMKTTLVAGQTKRFHRGQVTVDYEGLIGARSAVRWLDRSARAYRQLLVSSTSTPSSRPVPLREGACTPVNYCTSIHASNAPATSHGGVLTDLHESSERLDF